jgi:hypothetical protein
VLSAKLNRDLLVAWVAARRAAKTCHVSEMSWVARSRPLAAGREKAMPGSVGSPLVATGSMGERVFKAGTMPAGRRSWHRGEVNWGESDRSPLVVSESSWGEGVGRAAHGSPPVAGAGAG